jgi:hypothetical protein
VRSDIGTPVVPLFLTKNFVVIHCDDVATATWSCTERIVAELQTEPTHTYVGPWQSALLAQLVLHAPALQMYGAHGMVAGVTHAPLVLHVDAGWTVAVFGQLAATQVTPDAYFLHAPLPLQVPS